MNSRDVLRVLARLMLRYGIPGEIRSATGTGGGHQAAHRGCILTLGVATNVGAGQFK